jgi:aminocarboxymuconate-semialdehyde decarboxylase
VPRDAGSVNAAHDTVSVPVLDVHAHYFPSDLGNWAAVTGDDRWPSLAAGDDGTGQIMLGERVFRQVRAPLWDLDARTAELDAAGVARQVISPVPIMLTYWAEAQLSLSFDRAVNDSIGEHVAKSHGRLAGLGALPMQDVTLAVAELRRCVRELGLAGVEIGTQPGGREMDDPDLAPFFDAAAELDAAIFIHPLDGGGSAIRRGGQPYDFGLGMLTDTAMAATALICGGVLDRRPSLRIGLAHGCGTFPWAAPRLRMATLLTSDPGKHATFEELAARLWVDSLVLDPEHLGLLTRRFGAGHVMFGTDYPFIPGQLEGARDFIRAAVTADVIDEQQGIAILDGNIRAFIGGRAV